MTPRIRIGLGWEVSKDSQFPPHRSMWYKMHASFGHTFFMHLIKCKINETWTLIIAVNRSSKFLYWIQHYSITLTCIFSLWFNIWLVSWGQLVSLTFSSLRWGEVEDQRSVDSISLSRVGKSKIQNFLQFKSIDLISFKCNSYGRFQPFYKMLNLHFCVLVFWLVAWLNTACCC